MSSLSQFFYKSKKGKISIVVSFIRKRQFNVLCLQVENCFVLRQTKFQPLTDFQANSKQDDETLIFSNVEKIYYVLNFILLFESIQLI